MSEENVALVRRMVRKCNERGIEGVSREFLADNVESREPPEQPGAKVAQGREKTVERFRGRDGIEVAQPAGTIFTLRQGKVVRWEAFWNREMALEAAGLSE